MFLSKEDYFKRRWFLAVLFILIGFMLLYLSYGLFYYNKDKSDLAIRYTIPKLIKINKIDDPPSVALTILNDKNKIVSAIINDSTFHKVALLFKQPALNKYSFGNQIIFNKSVVKTFKYSYYRGKLYELEIDGVKIVE